MNSCCSNLDSAQIQSITQAIATALTSASAGFGSAQSGGCTCLLPVVVICASDSAAECSPDSASGCCA
jgi:hypothetical protein